MELTSIFFLSSIAVWYHLHSEKDLEKLLAAYARHSHSSAVLFGTTVQMLAQQSSESQRSTKDHALTTMEKQLGASTSTSLLRSGKHALSRYSMSRVLQRQSRLPKALSSSSTVTQQRLQARSSTANPGRTTATTDSACVQRTAVDTPASPPPYNFANYSDELLQASSLPPNQKRSLHVLTQSLAAGRRLADRGSVAASDADGLPPRGPGRAFQGQGGGRRDKQEGNGGTKSGRLLRRTLSSQSLQSIDSDISGTSSTIIHVCVLQTLLLYKQRLLLFSVRSLKSVLSISVQAQSSKCRVVRVCQCIC